MDSKRIKLNIEIEVEEKWGESLCSFLKYLEQQCEVSNEEEAVVFCIKGKNSNFHPKVQVKEMENIVDAGMQTGSLTLDLPCEKVYRVGD